MAQTRFGGFGPAGDALQFIVIGIGEKAGPIAERLPETRRAKVV